MEQLNTSPTSQGASSLFSTHHGHHTAPVFSSPYPGYVPLPRAELLLATALGIPQPSRPVFVSGRESLCSVEASTRQRTGKQRSPQRTI